MFFFQLLTKMKMGEPLDEQWEREALREKLSSMSGGQKS